MTLLLWIVESCYVANLIEQRFIVFVSLPPPAVILVACYYTTVLIF
jgi:hypothetical protein